MLHKAVLASFILAVFSLQGCSSLNPFPVEQQATLGDVASTHDELMNLPKPMGAIPVAVYSFRDQTGQYKPSDFTSSFSTAVTQGATSILMQALDDSAWFIPVEREGLQNILTERKIIRASNEAISKKNKNANIVDLQPLTTSKIILEGGIISYDSNIKTGGIGLGYYGISASEEYREDQISIYLRAIDVRSGQVLMSVNTTKKVLSQEMRAGLFRFVSFKELLEAEIGFTSNEPMHMCVLQAIEKSVAELIRKGIKKNIWREAEPS
ncbi:MAG: curli production assembly/transport component CsgG [Colwellia sp.]|jgi:curli production assembly/transport component CsgG